MSLASWNWLCVCVCVCVCVGGKGNTFWCYVAKLAKEAHSTAANLRLISQLQKKKRYICLHLLQAFPDLIYINNTWC